MDPIATIANTAPQAPTYHSTLPRFAPLLPSLSASARTSPGLPPPTYAPGFPRAPSGPGSAGRGDLAGLDFNIGAWSAARNGPQARLYESVARRRATKANEDAELGRALAETGFALSPLLPPAPSSTATQPATADAGASSVATAAGAATANAQTAPAPAATRAASETSSIRSAASSIAAAAAPTPTSLLPVSPHEDPDLVGPAAATAARERRLYLQGCAREERARRDQDALRREDASWNFMLAQMADWEGFRRDVRGKKGWRRFFR